MQTSLLIALAIFSFGASIAQAEDAGCAYRVSLKKETPVKVVVQPSGFTGRMSCGSEELPKLMQEIQGAITKTKESSFSIDLSNLEFYPTVREDIARALASDKNWNSIKGKPKSGTLQKALLPRIQSSGLGQAFADIGYQIEDAKIEDLKLEDHRKQNFSDPALKGRYPFAGTTIVQISKPTPRGGEHIKPSEALPEPAP